MGYGARAMTLTVPWLLAARRTLSAGFQHTDETKFPASSTAAAAAVVAAAAAASSVPVVAGWHKKKKNTNHNHNVSDLSRVAAAPGKAAGRTGRATVKRCDKTGLARPL